MPSKWKYSPKATKIYKILLIFEKLGIDICFLWCYTMYRMYELVKFIVMLHSATRMENSYPFELLQKKGKTLLRLSPFSFYLYFTKICSILQKSPSSTMYFGGRFRLLSLVWLVWIHKQSSLAFLAPTMSRSTSLPT